jgi:hypothetical protein
MKIATTETVPTIATTTMNKTAMLSPNDNNTIQNEVPEELENKSRSSDEEDVAEEIDQFNTSQGPAPKVNSSSTSFVLEVAPRNGRLGSKDPLFQGVCLYDGAMSTEQVENYSSNTLLATSSATEKAGSTEHRSSWTSFSAFRLFSNYSP